MTNLDHLQNALNLFLSQQLNTAKIPTYATQAIYTGNENRFQCIVVSLQNDGEHDHRASEFSDWIFLILRSAKSKNKEESHFISENLSPWYFSQESTDAFTKLVRTHENSIGADLLIPASHVFQRKPADVALGIRCDRFRLVAKLLTEFGTPPDAILKDWRNQLKHLQSIQAIQPSPNEMMVTDDGLLIPFEHLIGPWRTQFEQGLNSDSVGLNEPATSVEWPWQKETRYANQSSDLMESLDWAMPRMHPRVRRKHSRRSRSRSVAVAAIASSVVLLTITLWIFQIGRAHV